MLCLESTEIKLYRPFLRLLLAAAHLAVILVLRAQRLRVAEAAQAVSDRRVLLHVDREVKEVLVLAAHLKKKLSKRSTRN